MACMIDIVREGAEFGEILCFSIVFFQISLKRCLKNTIYSVMLGIIYIGAHFIFFNNTNPILVICYDGFYFTLFCLWTKLSVYKKIVYYLFSYCVCGGINLLITGIVSFMSGIKADIMMYDNLYRVILYLLVAFFLLLTGNFLQRNGKHMDYIYSIKLLVYSVFTVLLFLFFMYPVFYSRTADLKVKMQITVLLVGVILIVNIVTIFILQEKRRVDKQRILLQDTLLNLQREHYKEIAQKQDNIRKLRHDMKAHFMQLNLLYEKENKDDFELYLHNLLKKWDIYQYSNLEIGNSIANNIINYYIDLGKERGIVMICEGVFLENIKLTEMEMCSVLYNLIHNAYEECCRIDSIEKKIDINIKNYNKILFLTVSNSCKNVASMLYAQEHRTCKQDKEKHGLGIQIVQETVQRYGGMLNYRQEGEIFIAEAVLPDIYQ